MLGVRRAFDLLSDHPLLGVLIFAVRHQLEAGYREARFFRGNAGIFGLVSR
jgi:hypothetical protein